MGSIVSTLPQKDFYESLAHPTAKTNKPSEIPYILLAESDANIVAYILLIAGPLLAMVFFYFWQKTKRTRDLMTAT